MNYYNILTDVQLIKLISKLFNTTIKDLDMLISNVDNQTGHIILTRKSPPTNNTGLIDITIHQLFIRIAQNNYRVTCVFKLTGDIPDELEGAKEIQVHIGYDTDVTMVIDKLNDVTTKQDTKYLLAHMLCILYNIQNININIHNDYNNSLRTIYGRCYSTYNTIYNALHGNNPIKYILKGCHIDMDVLYKELSDNVVKKEMNTLFKRNLVNIDSFIDTLTKYQHLSKVLLSYMNNHIQLIHSRYMLSTELILSGLFLKYTLGKKKDISYINQNLYNKIDPQTLTPPLTSSSPSPTLLPTLFSKDSNNIANLVDYVSDRVISLLCFVPYDVKVQNDINIQPYYTYYLNKSDDYIEIALKHKWVFNGYSNNYTEQQSGFTFYRDIIRRRVMSYGFKIRRDNLVLQGESNYIYVVCTSMLYKKDLDRLYLTLYVGDTVKITGTYNIVEELMVTKGEDALYQTIALVLKLDDLANTDPSYVPTKYMLSQVAQSLYSEPIDDVHFCEYLENNQITDEVLTVHHLALSYPLKEYVAALDEWLKTHKNILYNYAILAKEVL